MTEEKKESIFGKFKKNIPKDSKTTYLIILLTAGVLVLLLSNFFSPVKENDGLPTAAMLPPTDVEVSGKVEKVANDAIASYEREYENQIKDAISKIVGVGKVDVVVNIESSEITVLEKNNTTTSQKTTEVDKQGGTRNIEDQSVAETVVIIRSGDKETPIVVETVKPSIRGVLVVAQGADNVQVKKWIIEAVTRALDVPSHRVAVMPMKTEEE